MLGKLISFVEKVKPKQKGIESFFMKKPVKTIDPSPSSISDIPIVTPCEKLPEKSSSSSTFDTPDPDRAVTPTNVVHMITTEKEIPSTSESLKSNHPTESSPSEFTERTVSSMSMSVREDENALQTTPDQRRNSEDSSSVVFPILDVDMGIERLVTSPSPLRLNTNSEVQAMKEEEITSFFISSPSCTNISLDHSLKLQSELLPSRVLAGNISMPSLRQIQTGASSTSASESKVAFINAEDPIISLEDKAILNDLLASPNGADKESDLRDINANPRQSGRKRKPVDAFDPTPVSKPKKTKNSKISSTETVTNDEVVISEPMEGVATSEDVIVVESMILDEEYLPEQDKANVGSKSKSTKTPAKSKKSSAKGTPAVTPVTPATPATPPPLPEEMQIKVDQLLEKMAGLASELAMFEGKSDYHDHELELEPEKFRADLLSVLCDPSAFALQFAPTTVTPLVNAATVASTSTSEEGAVPSTGMEVEEKLVEETAVLPTADATSPASTSPALTIQEICTKIVIVLITRVTQGSPLPLPRLIEVIREKIQELLDWTEVVALDAKDNLQVFIEELKRWHDAPTSSSSSSTATSLLASEIPILAIRECYGYRQKNALLFEDESLVGLYRWEVHSMQFFSKPSQSIIREVKTVRNRYSRAVRAMVKVIEQIHKTPNDASKLPPLEEKVAKAYSEIEKAKEKRREYEQKKALELEDKLKKQEAAEKKKKEKEEADLKKKQQQDALAQAKAAAQADKEKQKQEKIQKLEKQKSLFQSFLNKSASVNSSSSANALVEEIGENGNITIDMTVSENVPAVSTSSAPTAVAISAATSSKKIVRPAIIDLQAEEEKYTQFIQTVRNNYSFADITRMRRQQQSEKKERKRLFSLTQKKREEKKPKMIKIMVYTSASTGQRTSSAFAMDEEEYGELTERFVSNRMKTFFFQEDYRPAYVGTFSKRSTVVTGRRPFAKDHEHLNYDYDSEEEWEEEVEGEDIGESDNEDEEEELLDEEGKKVIGNDIIYDDFFRQDNDFGSDMDSDGEEIAAVAMPNFARIKEEILGLRFIDHTMVRNGLPTIENDAMTSSPSSVSSQPLIMKVEGGNKSSASSLLFGYKYQSSLEMSTLEEVNCREDHDANQLSNYYPIIFQPHLLALTREEEERQKNAPKKKKKPAANTSSNTPVTAPSSSSPSNPKVSPETADGTVNAEATAKKAPKKKKPKKVEGDGESEKKEAEKEDKTVATPAEKKKRAPPKKRIAPVTVVTKAEGNDPPSSSQMERIDEEKKEEDPTSTQSKETTEVRLIVL